MPTTFSGQGESAALSNDFIIKEVDARMAMRTGRAEKRIHLELPVQISRAQSLGLTELIEQATTENVSSRGIRVLTRRALPPQERLLVTPLVGSETPTPARVVYCQALAGELFGVGLRFQDEKRAT
jgi:hypothetical protein